MLGYRLSSRRQFPHRLFKAASTAWEIYGSERDSARDRLRNSIVTKGALKHQWRIFLRREKFLHDQRIRDTFSFLER